MVQAARLAERWELIVPSRRGFVPNPPEATSDFSEDAHDIAGLLGDLDEDVHLVGHSYGGLVALLATALPPERVRSITLIEPAVMSLMRGDPAVERSIAEYESLREAADGDPRALLSGFTELMGGDAAAVPDPLPDHVRQHVELFMHERVPWDAQIDLAPIIEAAVPALVVSGGHDRMQETMSDGLARSLGWATQRVVITGAAHLVQRAGEPFNNALEAFLETAVERR